VSGGESIQSVRVISGASEYFSRVASGVRGGGGGGAMVSSLGRSSFIDFVGVFTTGISFFTGSAGDTFCEFVTIATSGDMTHAATPVSRGSDIISLEIVGTTSDTATDDHSDSVGIISVFSKPITSPGILLSLFSISPSNNRCSHVLTSKRSSTQVSIFLSIPEMIASQISTNIIPSERLNHHRSSATPRKRVMIDRPQRAMRVSMRASPSA
jgi:hypothetical protein